MGCAIHGFGDQVVWIPELTVQGGVCTVRFRRGPDRAEGLLYVQESRPDRAEGPLHVWRAGSLHVDRASSGTALNRWESEG